MRDLLVAPTSSRRSKKQRDAQEAWPGNIKGYAAGRVTVPTRSPIALFLARWVIELSTALNVNLRILCRGETLLRSWTTTAFATMTHRSAFTTAASNVALPGPPLVASLLPIILDQPLHLSIHRLPDDAVRALSPIHQQRSTKFACDRRQQC